MSDDWKPIETLPTNRACDLVELLCCNAVVNGWMSTTFRCAPRVYFTRNHQDEIKYVKPTHWREIEAAPAMPAPSDFAYTPCVY